MSVVSPLMMVLGVVVVAADQTVVVRTMYGDVRGLRTRINHHMHVDTFLNIPYAKPPVGELRFQAPQRPEAWSGVRDGTAVGPQCPQVTFPEQTPPELRFPLSEDCLQLNVYTPKPSRYTCDLFPVMVWIHGGGFYQGSGNLYSGKQLATKGVVVVTINYRLDALGFLSTEDDVAMGNYGILDQIRALEWVRDVISAFKGDPDNVTIFGESAGGISVSLLLQARRARGLFHRAIMESGVSLMPGAVSVAGAHVKPEPLELTKRLARGLSCDSDNTTTIVSCLRTKDANDIINATWGESLSPSNMIVFRPTIFEGRADALFDATPWTSVMHDQFCHVPTIRGYNKDEWARFIDDPEEDGISEEEFRAALPAFVEGLSFDTDVNTTVERFMELYVYRPGIKDPRRLARVLIQLATDVVIVGPTLKELQLTSERTTQPQYLYRFSYRPELGRLPHWMGVPHLDEVAFVLGYPFTGDLNWPQQPIHWTDEDRWVSDDVMEMWANFARCGNPTPRGYDGVRWLPWRQAARHYLDIDIPTRRLFSDPPPDCPVMTQCG